MSSKHDAQRTGLCDGGELEFRQARTAAGFYFVVDVKN